MHASSYMHMEKLVARYLAPLQNRKLRVLDIGSCDINGSYRPLFQRPNWHYQGVDLSPGPNVDIALANPHRWQGIKTCSVDVVISGQAFEHIEFFWLTWREMVRASSLQYYNFPVNFMRLTGDRIRFVYPCRIEDRAVAGRPQVMLG